MLYLNIIYDYCNFLKSVTFIKVVNALKLLSSYYYSRATGSSHIKGYPMSMAFEPTTSCNLRCPECPSGLRSFTRKTGMLSPALLESSLEGVAQYLFNLTLYFQGEPYLNPRIFEMISIASTRNIYTTISTNGHYLDRDNCIKTIESGLDRLIISVDGTSQETYEKYRTGGNLQKVKEGIQNIQNLKKELKAKSPFIVLQFIIFNHNEKEIETFKAFAKQQSCSYQIKTAQLYGKENSYNLLPDNEKMSRYKLKDGKITIKHTLNNKCWKMWHSNVVTWDGNVVPCCFDKDAEIVLGNLNQSGLKEVWKSSTYENFRNKIFNERATIDMCKNCSEGSKIWL